MIDTTLSASAPEKTTTAKIVEPTIFDLSSPGRIGVTMPASDVPETALPPKDLLRSELPLPELAEVTWCATICISPNSTTAWTVASIRWVRAR